MILWRTSVRPGATSVGRIASELSFEQIAEWEARLERAIDHAQEMFLAALDSGSARTVRRWKGRKAQLLEWLATVQTAWSSLFEAA